MERYKYGVFIGRFQPFHNSHLRAILEAFQQVDHLIILVGSCNASRSTKNPFSFKERESFIRESILRSVYTTNFDIRPIRDYFYSDNTWVTQVQNVVGDITGDETSVCLIGNYKDASSYYINLFPQWELVPVTPDRLNATEIREVYLSSGINPSHLSVPDAVSEFLTEFRETPEYKNLCEESEAIKKYKKSWESSPFPPVFVTVDAVVVAFGHVLVVRRKFTPGKGLLALPGGFIRQNEKLEDACVRELREETGIRVHVPVLRSSIVDYKVFDHPNRSTRGRTITHAYYFQVNKVSSETPRHRQDLPEVRGGDDASQAMWIPLSRIFEEGIFYEDHADIISSFVVKS